MRYVIKKEQIFQYHLEPTEIYNYTIGVSIYAQKPKPLERIRDEPTETNNQSIPMDKRGEQLYPNIDVLTYTHPGHCRFLINWPKTVPYLCRVYGKLLWQTDLLSRQ